MNKIDKYIFYITVISAVLLFLIIFLNIRNGLIAIFRIFFGSIFILFLPGYWLTRVFFQKNEIDLLERFSLSFVLSISIVPLVSFYLNLVGLKITKLNVYFITLAIILFSVIYIFILKEDKYVKTK